MSDKAINRQQTGRRGVSRVGPLFSGQELQDLVIAGQELQDLVIAGQELQDLVIAGQELQDLVIAGQELQDLVIAGQELQDLVIAGQELQDLVIAGQELQDLVIAGQELQSWKSNFTSMGRYTCSHPPYFITRSRFNTPPKFGTANGAASNSSNQMKLPERNTRTR